MKSTGIIISLLLVWQASFSQWNDDFSDGDFIANPSWNGSVSDFIIESNRLRLNASAVSASSYLSTISESINEALWQFDLSMGFNPSSSNYVKIYIVSDQANISDFLRGYFIKVGGTEDEVSLYRQDGTDETEIIDGTDSRLNLSSIDVSIRLSRSTTGNWLLESKLSTEAEWFTEGSASDLVYESSKYFGVKCIYTSTRSTKFYFDNFFVSGDPYLDTGLPFIDTIFTTSSQKLQVHFNEEIDSVSCMEASNYLLNEQMNPVQITPLKSILELAFHEPLPVYNSIAIGGVKDVSGNEMDAVVTQFYYVDESPVKPREIIINEIMADPSPAEDLPEIEYVELYNNSSKAINVTEWSFSDLSVSTELGSAIIPPDSFLILCNTGDSNVLTQYGNVMGLSPWPSLNNSSDRIVLTDRSENIIDFIEYKNSWYDDDFKNIGGWSLELVDPNSECRNNVVWTSSINPQGGTPGSINSVISNLEDFDIPSIASAYTLSPDTIVIQFSESLSDQVPDIVIEGTKVLGRSFTSSDNNEVLVVVEPLLPRVKYTIVLMNFSDCAGNTANKDSYIIVLPEIADPQEIVISELLFNPRSNGVDFIEVYNNSPKYISLLNWYIDSEGSKKQIETADLIEPYNYRVFTSQPSVIIDQYPLAIDHAIYMQNIPLMSNKRGHVVLKNKNKEVIDSVRYEETWHFQYLTSFDGVSLERIDFYAPGYISSNWASAAQTENYATPGYENSQRSQESSKGVINISPRVIVPDANGVDDYTTIGMSDELSGTLATITIYNIQGVPVKQIANNTLVGINSIFTWDGTDRNGILVPLGHYIIVVEGITNDARTVKFREKVVVATGF